MLIGSDTSFVGEGYVGSDDSNPQTASPSSAIASWAIAAVAIVLGAISASPASATSTWTTPAAFVSVGAVSVAPSAAVSSWAANDPAISTGTVSGDPSPATSAWTSPAASVAVGAVTGDPSSAESTWNVPAVTVTGSGIAGPAPAVSTWASNDPVVLFGNVSGAPSPAVATWSVPTAAGLGGATASPAAVVATWFVPNASGTGAAPAVSLALHVDSTGGPRYRVRSTGGPSYRVDSTGSPRYRVVRGHEITSALEVVSNVIPYNSLSTHPLAEVVIDPSQFADTAAFSAWLDANFGVDPPNDYGLGSAEIDPSVLYNGGKTLKIKSGGAGSAYKNLVAPVDAACIRMPVFIPLTYTSTNPGGQDQIDFGEIIDDYDEFTFDHAPSFFLASEQLYDDGGFKDLPLAGLIGRWVYIIFEANHAVPAAATEREFVDNLFISDSTFDSGSGVPQIHTVNVLPAIRLSDAGFIDITDPNKVMWVGRVEVVPGAAQLLYSGLDTTITTLNPDPAIPASRVFPAEVLVQPSATYQFILLIDSVETAADSWATNATGGSISAGGLLTAGATSGEFTVTATKDAVDYVAQCEVAAFNPKTDVAGLYRWCEVNDLGLPDGTAIQTLTDTSGGGNDLQNAFPGSGAPAYRANAQNGYAASETDGMADVHLSGEVPFGAHTTFTACKILPGGDHEDYCVPMQRWAEGAFSTILRFITGSSLNNRWQVTDTTPGASVNLGGDSLNWSLVTDRLVSDTVQEVSLNDGAAATMTPVAGMFDGPAAVQDRIHAHTTSDVSKMQLLLDVHWTVSMTDTEKRKSRRWINGRYRLY